MGKLDFYKSFEFASELLIVVFNSSLLSIGFCIFQIIF